MVCEPLFVFFPWAHKCQQKACFYMCQVSIPMYQWSTGRCFQLGFAVSQISHRCLYLTTQVSPQSALIHFRTPSLFICYSVLFLQIYLSDIILFAYFLPICFLLFTPSLLLLIGCQFHWDRDHSIVFTTVSAGFRTATEMQAFDNLLKLKRVSAFLSKCCFRYKGQVNQVFSII